MNKRTELYDKELYTVIPIDKDYSVGILPVDQGFSKKYVLLWDFYRDLIKFEPGEWKKLKVKLPESIIRTIQRIPDKAYGISYVSSAWIVDDVTNNSPQYND